VNAAFLVLAMSAVVFEAPPVVGRFQDSNAFVRVIHGPVGSGKSSGSIIEILRRAAEQEPNAKGVRDTRWVIVRNTYRELEDTTRRTFEQWLGELGQWREADFAFDIERPLADGTSLKAEILFRALDRPQDVKKLLSLEITGAYVNELREVPKAILDGLTMRVGRYPAKKDGGATWWGVWADTNPWAESSEYAELFANPPDGFEIFRQPSGLSDDAENRENLPAGYYQRMMAGKDSEWVDEYVHGKNPRADKGSIYGKLLADLAERGRIGEFDHPKDGVYATFDLGVSDSTAIWFWRLNKHGVPDFIDWYECSGEGFEHYRQVLQDKGYQYRKIWLPHDARQRTFQTGISTLELFAKEFPGLVAVTPELTVAGGIEATRWLFEKPVRFKESTCADGLRRLKAYRYQWDEDRKVFSRQPLHDWTSHTADAVRYVACAVKSTEALIQPVEAKRVYPAPPQTMDELFRAHMAAPKRRRA
jgi:hypothetical protein